MESFKNTIIILLLTFGLLTPIAQAKSPSVLLQEGIYAEQTEGDLEKAISLYKQVLDQTKEIERIAARATYQLGMCHLKKGDKEKAAEYFQQVVSNYPTQKILAKKATKQLGKVSSVKDIIARSYVIHYRAVDQSKNALELLNRNHPRGVRTHHANRYRKKGITINSICTDNEAGKDKIVAAINDSDELELVKVDSPETKESVFEQIDYQVTRFLGEQFGKIALEAGQQHLSVNSHIYYVDSNGFRYSGGMNAFYNWTGRTITRKVSFGGTSYPNQTHYGVDGCDLNTEIVPHKTRANHWQIYWTPDEPLAPEEHLYYGWSMNNKRKLPQLPDGVYSLKMQNKYGSPVIETFFLVLPKDLKISQSNPPTSSQELLNFNVYWWTKQVKQGENHAEHVSIEKRLAVVDTLKSFISASISGNTEEAMKLVMPGSAVVNQLEDFTEIPNYKKMQIASVHADNKTAFAITDIIFTDNGRNGLLTITLIKRRGLWMVEDIDMETSEKAEADLQAFLKQYPTARDVSISVISKTDKLLAEAMMTQEMHNTIDANGLIHFKSPNKISNNGSEPITTTGFINSDFVMLTEMYEESGTAVPFETTHEGNIYRYRITFNKPIMPGESMVYYTKGTIRGLIKSVPGKQDVFRYFMKHSPAAGQPVLRIETYLLPEDAAFISTSTPDIQKTEKDGRIELRVEKVVPANGNITTEFQYKLSALAEPLKLEAAPWIDGEVMEVRLKRPAGNEYGTIIYSAQSNVLDGNDTWQIISHMYVTQGSLSQYTFVEAAAESFVPVYGQTTNWMGNFVAEYNERNVKLTTGTEAQKNKRDVPVDKIAYDNEQALYLIRRMPLAEDYQGSFPIFSVQGGVTIECRIKVLGIEEVTVEAGTFKCYKTDLSIYMDEVKTLQHTLWFSADEHKYLVKYDVGGSATMELAKVWQKDNDKPLTFENEEPAFSVTIPADWRFYSHGSGPQFSLQLIPPEVRAWAVLIWQKRGTDPDSASAMTIAKADFEKLKEFFENYTMDETSWKEFKINGLEAAQYLATYQDKGSGMRTYTKPQEMVEYRTYIVDDSNVYWFVFRVEKDKFEQQKSDFDKIINSFDKIKK